MEIGLLCSSNCSLEKNRQRRTRPKSLRMGRREGESPIRPEPFHNTRCCQRVELFGNASLIGQ
ncbi:hypothetical protein KSP40_PGU006166 [Platanthera guangdongensis]|uniref:Uncharacterized protein n=1 Tax=Platanthera guangdongensis TaxID=2320717 RepID=A0ABR2LZ30_9ASPA